MTSTVFYTIGYTIRAGLPQLNVGWTMTTLNRLIMLQCMKGEQLTVS